jgi:hypothetical protein
MPYDLLHLLKGENGNFDFSNFCRREFWFEVYSLGTLATLAYKRDFIILGDSIFHAEEL